jgi:hypothetical protein
MRVADADGRDIHHRVKKDDRTYAAAAAWTHSAEISFNGLSMRNIRL